MGRDADERTASWSEVLRGWVRRTAGPAAPGKGEPGVPGEPPAESVVALTCVVERTQALVRQLEAELQSERAQMAARIEWLAEENRRLQERLRERPGETRQAPAPPPSLPGRVSPFRRGQRGL